ncbi:hypothetical protein MNBD_GAMMA26-10 [hydrothermal vent metagenome]|uniref:AAA domain-containing protein n=1 Tax=hydrothermal vent metagenome TaxID=652676 RepID=A0A3B1AZV6_9ZZZZ
MTFSKIIKDYSYALQVRGLSEHLNLGMNGKPYKLVLASGIQRGDGTSSLVESLAVSLAENPDNNVLVIACCDTDDCNDFIQLTETSSIAEIIKHPVSKGVHAVKCLDKKTLSRWSILQKSLPDMLKEFTHILIDGPPISSEPEMLRIIPDVDYVLLILKAHSVKWQVLNKVKQLIEQIGQNNIGVVLNRRKFFIPEKLYKLI